MTTKLTSGAEMRCKYARNTTNKAAISSDRRYRKARINSGSGSSRI